MTDLKEQSQLRTRISLDRQFARLPMIIFGDKRRGILAEQIYLDKMKDINTLSLEKDIDFLVYHLYALTYDKVQIVDSETSITREEYDMLLN